MQQDPIVYIVDDSEGIRSALRLLMKSANLRAVTCASAEEFLKTYQPDVPGCLLLDLCMPGMGGLELQQRLQDRHIRVPVVIMSGHCDVTTAVQAMKGGAVDFIEKPFKNEVLLARVKQCVASDVQTRKVQRQHMEAAMRIASLTPREREVMELLIQGKRNKIIAADLGISNRTVEAHRAKIMEKMHAHSLSEIVRTSFAAEEGTAGHD